MSDNDSNARRIFSWQIVLFVSLAFAFVMISAPQYTAIPSLRGSSTKPMASEEGFAQSCTNPTYPTGTPAVMDTTACGIDGNGGAEAPQNEAKNNFCAPSPAKAISISDMVNLQTKVQQDQAIAFGNRSQHPLTSKAGPVENRSPLIALGEGNQVVLSGYVRIARQEGAESVNCGSHVPNATSYHDIHISVVQNPGDDECTGVVVEMSPHHRPAQWKQANVQAVAQARLLVRVTGQLMFDSSHTPCSNGTSVKGDPARASLWEIHPIYKFEVCPKSNCDSDTDWLPLEEWKRT